MEQKTAEEILLNQVTFRDKVKQEFVLIAMQAYSKQEVEIAVEKALEIASEKASNSDGISFGILDLKDEVLLELNK